MSAYRYSGNEDQESISSDGSSTPEGSDSDEPSSSLEQHDYDDNEQSPDDDSSQSSDDYSSLPDESPPDSPIGSPPDSDDDMDYPPPSHSPVEKEKERVKARANDSYSIKFINDKMRMDNENEIASKKLTRQQQSDDKKKQSKFQINNSKEHSQEEEEEEESSPSPSHYRGGHGRSDSSRRDGRGGKGEIEHLESQSSSSASTPARSPPSSPERGSEYRGERGGEEEVRGKGRGRGEERERGGEGRMSSSDGQNSSHNAASRIAPSTSTSTSSSQMAAVRLVSSPPMKQLIQPPSPATQDTDALVPLSLSSSSTSSSTSLPSPGKKSVRIVPPKPPRPMSPPPSTQPFSLSLPNPIPFTLHGQRTPPTAPASPSKMTSPPKPFNLSKSLKPPQTLKSPQTPRSARGVSMDPFNHYNTAPASQLAADKNTKSPSKPLKPPKPSPIPSLSVPVKSSDGSVAGGVVGGEMADARVAPPPPPPPPPIASTSTSSVQPKILSNLVTKLYAPSLSESASPLPLPAGGDSTASRAPTYTATALPVSYPSPVIGSTPIDHIEYQDYRCDSLDEDREGDGEEVVEGGGEGRGAVGGRVGTSNTVAYGGADSTRADSHTLSDLRALPSFECSEFDSEDGQHSFPGTGTDDVSSSCPDLECEFQDESFFPYRTSDSARSRLSLSSSRGYPRTGPQSRSYMSPHKRREAEDTERQAKKGKSWQVQQQQQQIRLAHWQQQQQQQDIDKDKEREMEGGRPQSSLSPARCRSLYTTRADTPSRYFRTYGSSLSPARALSRPQTAPSSSSGIQGRGRGGGRGGEVEVGRESSTACSTPSRAPYSPFSPTRRSSSSLYQSSVLSPPSHPEVTRGGYIRQEVIDEKIKVPRYSVLQVRLLCGWLNSLHLWHRVIEVENIQAEVRTGVLLVRLVQTLDPHSVFVNVTQRVMSAKPAIENIEQVLGNVLRSMKINTNRIPLPSDIFEGHFLKTVCFLFELFDVYVSSGWGGWCSVRCRDMLVWYNRILSQYSRALNNNALGCAGINSRGGTGGAIGGGERGVQGCQGDKLISPQHHFRTGTDLFCVIYHFYGPALLHPAPSLPSRPLLVEPSRMYFEPLTMSELRVNVSYVFNLLEVLGVDVIWTVDEWVSLDDPAFCILQLSKVYAHCKNRRCAVPLADPVTAAPGLTSGPLGLPLVVGLVFADTPPPPPPSTSNSYTHSGTGACTGHRHRAHTQDHTRGCNQGRMQSGVGSSAEVYDLLSFKEHEERASAKTAFSVPSRSTAATATATSHGIDCRERGGEGRGGGGEREGQGQGQGEWQGEYEGRGEGQGEGSSGLEDNALCMMHSSLSGSRSSFSTGKPHPSLTRTGSSRSPGKAVPYTNFADGCPKGLLSSMCFQQLQLDRNKERVREKEREREGVRENAMMVAGVAGVVSKKATSVDDGGKYQNMDIQYEKKVKLKMKKEDKLEDEKDIDRKTKKELEMEIDKEKSRAREVERYRDEMSRQRGVWAALASTRGVIDEDTDRDRAAGASREDKYTTTTTLTSRVDDERERERDLMLLSSPPPTTTTTTTTGAGYLLNARARQSEKEKEAEVDDRSGWKKDRETLFSSRKDENILASSLYDKRSGDDEEGRKQDRDGVEVNENEYKKEGNEEDKMSAYLLHLQSMNQRTDAPIERRRSSQFPSSSSTAPTTTTTGTSTGRGSLLVPQGIVYIPPNLYGTPLRASLHSQAAIFPSLNDGAREHVSESDQHHSRSSKTDVENEVEKEEEDITDARIREWRRHKLEKEYLERELREGGGVREGEGGKHHNTSVAGAGMSYDPTRYGVRLPGGTMAWNTSLREAVPVSSGNRVSLSGCGTLDIHSLNSTMKSQYYISNSPPPSPPPSPPRPSLSPSPSPTPSSPVRSNGCSEERKSAGVWCNPFAALLVSEQAQGSRGGAGVRAGSPLPSASSSSSSSFSTGTSPSPAERNGKRHTPVQRKTCSPSPPPPAPAHSSPSYSLRFSSPSNRHFSPPPSRIILPSFPSSSPSYNSSPSPSIRSAEVVAGGEKGWIPHTNKGYTHNVPLNHACAHAMATRMGTLVPPKLRDEAIALLLEEREGAGAGRQLRASHTRSPASSASPSPARHVQCESPLLRSLPLRDSRTGSPLRFSDQSKQHGSRQGQRGRQGQSQGTEIDSDRIRHFSHNGSKDQEFNNGEAMIEIQQIFNEIRESECSIMRFEDGKRQQHYRDRSHVESA